MRAYATPPMIRAVMRYIQGSRDESEPDDRCARRVDGGEARRIDLLEKILRLSFLRPRSAPDDPRRDDDAHGDGERYEHRERMVRKRHHHHEKDRQSPERREISRELAGGVHNRAVPHGL
jgi:hypothetical protein